MARWKVHASHLVPAEMFVLLRRLILLHRLDTGVVIHLPVLGGGELGLFPLHGCARAVQRREERYREGETTSQDSLDDKDR